MLEIDNNTKAYLQNRVAKEDGSTFPGTILLDTISYCNLRCTMCYRSMINIETSIMPIDLYKRYIDEIAEKRPSCRVWLVAIGEPFILKDLAERVSYAKNKGLTDVVLNSNGTLLTYENSKAVIEAGLDVVYIGIDAATQETYEKIRYSPTGPTSLQKTTEGVLAYKRALNDHGNGKQELFVQFVVMDSNEHQKDDFIAFWKSKDVNVKIRPLSSWAGKLEIEGRVQQIDRLPCKWMMTDLTILSDGRIPYCANVQEDDQCVATMTPNTTIEEIWTELEAYRRVHKTHSWNELPTFCRDCLDWQAGYAQYV